MSIETLQGISEELNLELEKGSLVPESPKRREMVITLNKNSRKREIDKLFKSPPIKKLHQSPITYSKSRRNCDERTPTKFNTSSNTNKKTDPEPKNHENRVDRRLSAAVEAKESSDVDLDSDEESKSRGKNSDKAVPKHKYRRNVNRWNRHLPVEATESRDFGSESEEEYIPKKKKLDRQSLSQHNSINSTTDRPHVPRVLTVPKSPGSVSVFGSTRNRWEMKETEEFYQAVMECGVGAWKDVRLLMQTERTNVQLKDKWRTISKTGEIKRLEKKFGCV